MIARKDLSQIHAHSCLLKNVSGLIRDCQSLLQMQSRLYITLADHIGGPTVLRLLQFLYLGWWSRYENSFSITELFLQVKSKFTRRSRMSSTTSVSCWR